MNDEKQQISEEVSRSARLLERGDKTLDKLTKRAVELRVKGGWVSMWEKWIINRQLNRLAQAEIAGGNPFRDRLALMLAAAYAILGEDDPRYMKLSQKIAPFLSEPAKKPSAPAQSGIEPVA